MKARKRYKISSRMLVAWFTLAGVILLLAPQSVTGKLQSVFTGIFKYPLRLGRGITLSARIADEPDYDFQQREVQYQNHITNLVAEIEYKNSQIAELAKIRYRQHGLEGASLVMADVISAVLEGSKNEIIIDRGEIDGIRNGQFVIGENSIIGVIDRLWSRQAKVKLITDSSFRLTVTCEKFKKAVWLFGSGNGQAIIRWIKDKPEKNCEILAQKQPGLLDCPMIIGRVSQCSRNPDNAILWDVTVRPASDIAMLASVMVIAVDTTQ